MLAFSNSLSFPPESHIFNSNSSQILFTARSIASVIGHVFEKYPHLVEILKSTSITINAKRAGTDINLSFDTMTKNQHGNGGYEIGKTGDNGEIGHEIFVIKTPSGKSVYGATFENPSRVNRWVNISSIILCLPNLHPKYRSAEINKDPTESNLAFRVQGDALVDISPNPKTIAGIGSPKIQDSLFFKDKAIQLSPNSGILIGGNANIGLNDFTLEAYFRKIDGLAIASTCELIGQWTRVDGGRSWSIQLLANGTICFWYSVDGTQSAKIETVIPTLLLTKKMPVHIVIQRKSGVLAMFINGVVMVSAEANVSFYSTESNIIVGCRATAIGGQTYENHLSGVEIHEVSLKIGWVEYPMSGFTPIYRWKRWN